MRKDSREAVFKILFAGLFNNEGCDDEFKEYIYDDCKLKDSDREFAVTLLNKITDNYEYLLETLSNYTKEYKLDRLYTSDKCALLIGMCEIKFFDDVPNVVAIDEAVNLARRYSTESSLSFVNGVLAEYKRSVENV